MQYETIHTVGTIITLSKVSNQVFFESGNKQWTIERFIYFVMVQWVSCDTVDVDVGVDILQLVIHVCIMC